MKILVTKRNATESDTTFARQAHHRAYHDVVVRQFGNWDEKMQDDFFDASWRPDTHEIISCDGSLCGYCAIEHTPERIFVHELVLLPEFQGKGIGSIILQTLIDDAARQRIPIKLQVLKENHAQSLYRKLGFTDTRSTDTHFEMTFNPTSN